MTGFVYLIESANGTYKVGYSEAPESRLRTLQTASAFNLTLVGYAPGNKSHEAELHALMAPWKVIGEWFTTCPAIEALKRSLPAPSKANTEPTDRTEFVGALIEKMGGPTRATEKLGLNNPSIVMNWRTRGQVPANRVSDVAALTRIPAHEIRPDVFAASLTTPMEEVE